LHEETIGQNECILHVQSSFDTCRILSSTRNATLLIPATCSEKSKRSRTMYPTLFSILIRTVTVKVSSMRKPSSSLLNTSQSSLHPKADASISNTSVSSRSTWLPATVLRITN
ncbi:hypothetical protein PFISCL1PPCAC_9102, partial [Pristionchus fissidentatus]